MRIGFDHYTIGHRGLSPEATLEFAASMGLDGVQFLEPSAIDPAIDHRRLAEVRRQADAMGLYLEVGFPCPNPVRRSRSENRSVSAAEHARDLLPHLEALAPLGVRHARAFVGDRHDRFRTDVSWADQRTGTIEVLRTLGPELKALDVRVAIETHADLTCDELLSIVDSVGDDLLGVTIDTGNLPMRLDDPIEAAGRLAPLVLMSHLKDAALAFTDRGLCWQARPVGTGCIPIAEIIGILGRSNPRLNLSIELHPRIYDLPIFDPSWLAFFPGLRPSSMSSVVRLAALCERRYADGSMERPEAIEAAPWDDRAEPWIKQSVEFLRNCIELT